MILDQLPGGKETILLVEDDHWVRELTAQILTRVGYEVLEANDGREALAVWEQSKDKISLVITDLVMPVGLTGRELAALVLKDRPGTKVLFSSGYSLAAADIDLSQDAKTGYLQKPFTPQMLTRKVRDFLDGLPDSSG